MYAILLWALAIVAKMRAMGINIRENYNCDKQFWINTLKEVDKINGFYVKKRTHNNHRLEQLRVQHGFLQVRAN
jgi:hypothetical protein